MKKTLIITGCAGFIGFHLCRKLENKFNIIGIDKISNYYSIKLKRKRLEILKKNKNFKFYKSDLSNKKSLNFIKKNKKIYAVIHLAAQAGVRNSIHKPYNYIKDNITSQINIYEKLKEIRPKIFVYASSSSVYGTTKRKSFNENQTLLNPLSLYSATKQSVEQISKYYSNFYNIPSIGLRFFTCYGPWGRPDLSVSKITEGILRDKKVVLLNYGKTKRDFTYVDDTILGIEKCLKYKNFKKNYHEIFNLGTGKSYSTLKLTKTLGSILKIKFDIIFKKHHPTDMQITNSDMRKSYKILKYKPKISLENGLKKFLKWYLEYEKT